MIAARLDALIAADDATSRLEAANWAMEYFAYDDPQVYPRVRDPAVREALAALSGADIPTTDRPFLYGPDDFRAWRAQLLAAPSA